MGAFVWVAGSDGLVIALGGDLNGVHTMQKAVGGSVSGCTCRRRILQILQFKTFTCKFTNIEIANIHLIPSSSDDFTLARMTSEANGRKMTIRNTTAN